MSFLDRTKITQLREQRGWDQKDLADAAGVNPAVISRLERNLQEDFKLSVAISLARALGVTVDHIISEEFRSQNLVFSPELLSAISHLASYPFHVQSRIAAVIEAYLAAIDREERS